MGSVLYIVLNSKIEGLYLVLGLWIMAVVVSIIKLQIQLKFVNILLVGLFTIALAIIYSQIGMG